MADTVFYSWQADTEQKVNRYLIRDALEEALKKCDHSLEMDEATRDVSGSPDIFASIIHKIQKASIFVVDLTIVGKYSEEKSTPNPNVLIEYGLALNQLGYERIIPVYNEHYGKVSDLPFDLRGRVVRCKYQLEPGIDKEWKKKVEKLLSGQLCNEINLVLDKALFQGLSKNSIKTIRIFCLESEYGAFREPKLSLEEFMIKFNFTEREARNVIDELEFQGLVGKREALGGKFRVYPTSNLYWRFDRVFQEWDTKKDALKIAQILVAYSSKDHNQLLTSKLIEKLGWELRRINPALTYLVENCLVMDSKNSAKPKAVHSIIETQQTRFFLAQNGISIKKPE